MAEPKAAVSSLLKIVFFSFPFFFFKCVYHLVERSGADRGHCAETTGDVMP